MTAYIQPAVGTSFNAWDKGIHKNILEYLVFSQLPEDILRSILFNPTVFQITWDLSLGKWVTLSYWLYFETVGYFSFF